MKSILYLCLIICLIGFFEAQATNKFYSGTYTQDLTWSKDTADTIIVANNTEIRPGNILTIEEGMVIELRGRFTVYSIHAKGLSNDPISIYRSASASISTSFEVPQFTGRDTAHFEHVRFDTIRLNLASDVSLIYNCEFYGNSGINSRDDLWVDSSSFIGSNQSRVISGLQRIDVRNSEFRNNGVGSGSLTYSVIYVSGGASEIHNNQFINNASNPIYLRTFSLVNIRDNIMKGNVSSFSPIHFLGVNPSGLGLLNIQNNLIDSNFSARGGAMYFSNQVRGEISGNIISRNTASRSGGGVYTTSPLEDFRSNLLVNNRAGEFGGGIALVGSSGICLIKNCIIANNSARNGGGVYHNFVNTKIINSTIVNNYDTLTAGAIRTRSSASNSGLDVYNSIIYGNRSGSGANQIDFISGSFNIMHSNIEGSYAGLNNLDQNPLFINPSSGAGAHIDARNADWSLNDCSSPMINAGNKDTLIALSAGFYDYTSSEDFNGDQRVTRKQIDVGAHETDGINNQDAWTSNPICSNDSLISVSAVFESNGSGTNTTWQLDTVNGIWQTIIPALTPGISQNGDTLIASLVPQTLLNANFRAISSFGCFTDTSIIWNPNIIPVTFGAQTLEICSGDSADIFGVWQTVAGVYSDTLVNNSGCDSIVSTTLIEYPTYLLEFFDTICVGETYTWNGQTYNNAGDYPLNYSSSSPLACDSTVILHLAEFPVLFSQLEDTTFGCEGDTITFDLSDPNLSTYRWSLDGTSFDTNSSFSFVPINFWQRAFVTVTDVNGCETSATRDYLKIQLDAYVIQADPSNDPFVDFSFNLGPPNNANSFYWAFGDGDTSSQASVSHEYTSNATYEYCMVVDYACGIDSSCNSIDIFRVGTDESIQDLGIGIFPNPANQELNLRIPDHIRLEGIDLLDSKGSLIKTIDSQVRAIDIEDLSKGLYFLNLSGDHRTYQLRFIKD